MSSVRKSVPSSKSSPPVGLPSAPANRSSTPVSVPSWSTSNPSSVPVSHRSTSSSVPYSVSVISSTPARVSATQVGDPSGSAGGSSAASALSAPTDPHSSDPINDPPTSVGRHPTAPTTTITVTNDPTATSISQCNSGRAQCCNSVQSASSSSASKVLGLVGAVVAGADVLVGLGCTSILGVGALGTADWLVSLYIIIHFAFC